MIQLDESGATIGYRVASPAASVTATIKGEDGAVLRVLNDLPSELDTLNEVPWDGLDDNGQPVPEGSYSVEITALDEEDNAILTQSYSRSLVERMTFDQGLATLHLANGDSILAGLIEEIE